MDIDANTFAGWYDRYARKIFAFCFVRTGSREAAEDLTSHTFMRAWDHGSQGKQISNVQGFLFRIAGNLVIDFYRKRGSSPEVSLDDPAAQIDIPDTTPLDDRMDTERALKEIMAFLERLAEPYRDVVVLRYFNDLSVGEIAQIMETSENNVSVRLHRALEQIKKLSHGILS